MSSNEPTATRVAEDGYEYRPEQPPVVSEATEQSDPSENLDTAKLKAELDSRLQESLQAAQKYVMQQSHAWILLGISVAWILVILVVVLLEGFHGAFMFRDEDSLPFHLTDTVLIAFITSTTATILGLYGLAGYWLYGKALEPNSKEPKDEKDSKAG